MATAAEVGIALQAHMNSKIKGVQQIAFKQAKTLESQAKVYAPWSDITGDARNGLIGSSDLENGEIAVVLAHTVSYGVYLEKNYQGRFATLYPVMSRNVADMTKELDQYWKS